MYLERGVVWFQGFPYLRSTPSFKLGAPAGYCWSPLRQETSDHPIRCSSCAGSDQGVWRETCGTCSFRGTSTWELCKWEAFSYNSFLTMKHWCFVPQSGTIIWIPLYFLFNPIDWLSELRLKKRQSRLLNGASPLAGTSHTMIWLGNWVMLVLMVDTKPTSNVTAKWLSQLLGKDLEPKFQ